VFENRDTKTGRLITLRVVVLPAVETALHDPIFFLAGGPGQAATDSADFAARAMAGAHRTRDIVLVDVRRVTISHGALATTLMTLLRASSSAWQIPGIIRQAAAGDMTPLAAAIHSLRDGQQRGIAFGMHLSVMCAESNPDIAAEPVRSESEGTFPW
jgi:hypothetical protein